jgi:hypothetical protein
MNTARVEKQIDGKLNDQFRYFRREFMEAASVQGVTMPLELVEDKSGRFFTFVNANGPRYLLHIIHSQQEASAIMRCAISLLIVSMAILRRKLPENRPKAAGTNWMSLLSGNINSWAFQILQTISDGPSVSICINLLAKSKILVIRELVLSLLALLVNASEEAVIQMLTSPTHQQISAQEMEERFRKENANVPSNYKLTIDEKVKFNPSTTYGNCLAVMFAIVADNRNHYSIVSACAEVVIAMTSGNHKSAKVAVAIAQTSVQGPPPKERKESEQKTLLKTVLNPRSNAPSKPSPASPPAPKHSGDVKKRDASGLWVSGGEGEGEATASHEPKAKDCPPLLATWDGIHILVQFLHRFFRYTDIASPDQSWNSMSQGDRQRLVQSHNRIVFAVASLIALAPEIGYYLYQMPKARGIVVTSAKFFLTSHQTAAASPHASLQASKDRNSSVGIVSAALDILSPEYQATYLARPASRTSPTLRGKANTLCSFNEMDEDEPISRGGQGQGQGPQLGGQKGGDSPPPGVNRRKSQPGRAEGGTSRHRQAVEKSNLQAVQGSQQKERRHTSAVKKSVNLLPYTPEDGTHSLSEFANLFTESSDWQSLETGDDPTGQQQNPDDFGQKLKLDYDEMRRSERQGRGQGQGQGQGQQGKGKGQRPPSGESGGGDGDRRRPSTAPEADDKAVCEFFKCMPSAPSLPRRLTSIDVACATSATKSATKSRPRTGSGSGLGRGSGSPAQSAPSTAPEASQLGAWPSLDEKLEAFEATRGLPRSRSAKGSRPASGPSARPASGPGSRPGSRPVSGGQGSKLLDGAMHAYRPPKGRGSAPKAAPSSRVTGGNSGWAEEESPHSRQGQGQGQGQDRHEDMHFSRVDLATGGTVEYDVVVDAQSGHGSGKQSHSRSRPSHDRSRGSDRGSDRSIDRGSDRGSDGYGGTSRPEGMGHPEPIVAGPRLRPPSEGRYAESNANSNDMYDMYAPSLFHSVIGVGDSDVSADAGAGGGGGVGGNSPIAIPAPGDADQPSMWVSEADDKNNLSYILAPDPSQERVAGRGDGSSNNNNSNNKNRYSHEGDVSRMLIADIISTFDEK